MRRRCDFCAGYVEHQEEDGEVLHQCIHCARMMSEGFICDPVVCRRSSETSKVS